MFVGVVCWEDAGLVFFLSIYGVPEGRFGGNDCPGLSVGGVALVKSRRCDPISVVMSRVIGCGASLRRRSSLLRVSSILSMQRFRMEEIVSFVHWQWR